MSGGIHNVTVYAHDLAGNMGASTTVYFTVDKPVPVAVWVAVAMGTAVVSVVIL